MFYLKRLYKVDRFKDLHVSMVSWQTRGTSEDRRTLPIVQKSRGTMKKKRFVRESMTTNRAAPFSSTSLGLERVFPTSVQPWWSRTDRIQGGGEREGTLSKWTTVMIFCPLHRCRWFFRADSLTRLKWFFIRYVLGDGNIQLTTAIFCRICADAAVCFLDVRLPLLFRTKSYKNSSVP